MVRKHQRVLGWLGRLGRFSPSGLASGSFSPFWLKCFVFPLFAWNIFNINIYLFLALIFSTLGPRIKSFTLGQQESNNILGTICLNKTLNLLIWLVTWIHLWYEAKITKTIFLNCYFFDTSDMTRWCSIQYFVFKEKTLT